MSMIISVTSIETTRYLYVEKPVTKPQSISYALYKKKNIRCSGENSCYLELGKKFLYITPKVTKEKYMRYNTLIQIV